MTWQFQQALCAGWPLPASSSEVCKDLPISWQPVSWSWGGMEKTGRNPPSICLETQQWFQCTKTKWLLQEVLYSMTYFQPGTHVCKHLYPLAAELHRAQSWFHRAQKHKSKEREANSSWLTRLLYLNSSLKKGMEDHSTALVKGPANFS